MSSLLIFDILDAILSVAIAPLSPEQLPPPMTRTEVFAQQLYTDDCTTTRDGVDNLHAFYNHWLRQAHLVEPADGEIHKVNQGVNALHSGGLGCAKQLALSYRIDQLIDLLIEALNQV